MAKREGADGPFRGVVAYGDIPVFVEDARVLFVIDAVLQGLGGLTLCGHVGKDLLCPRKEDIHLRIFPKVSLLLSVSFGKRVQPVAQLEDLRYAALGFYGDGSFGTRAAEEL